MIAIACFVCLFVGAAFGYFIADKASQHAILAARAEGILDYRNDEAWERQSLLFELQRLRIRNRQLEAKDQVIRTEST